MALHYVAGVFKAQDEGWGWRLGHLEIIAEFSVDKRPNELRTNPLRYTSAQQLFFRGLTGSRHPSQMP
jgi:hypothetical protein